MKIELKNSMIEFTDEGIKITADEIVLGKKNNNMQINVDGESISEFVRKEWERINRVDKDIETVTKDDSRTNKIKNAGEYDRIIFSGHINLQKMLLNNGYKWLARDENAELWAHEELPYKAYFDWESNADVGVIRNDNFPQIQWEDSEPTKIVDLLETYENGGESRNL